MGVYTPYLNVYYERIGLSGSQIGLIHAAGYLAAMLFSPLWGNLTDRTHRYKSIISFLLLATSFSGIIWKQQTSFFLIFIFSLFINIFRSNIGNIFDGFCVQFCEENQKQFSLIRSMGSLGYLIGSFVIGNIMFEIFHIQGPYIRFQLIVASLACLLLWFVKNPSFRENKKQKLKTSLSSLFHNQDYLFILILCFFTIMAMDSGINYIGNHLVATIGSSDSSIGWVTCAMVLPEILIVMNIHRFLHRYGLKKMFFFAVLLQMLRWLVYALARDIAWIMAVSSVHGVMIGVGTVGVVSYIHSKVDSSMLATAMTVYGGFTVIGYALQAQLFGSLYQFFGSSSIYLTCFFFAVIALILIIKTKHLD